MAKTEPQVETVTMDDGRVVEFAGKRKLIKTSIAQPDGVLQVRLDFRNGETRLVTLNPVLVSKFALHGAEQKLGDEIAGLKKEDGSEADIEDAVLAIDNLVARLDSGEWTTVRDSNGMAGTSVLLKALVEFKNGALTVEKAKEFLSKKTHADKVALRNNPQIKPIVERLEAEKAAKRSSKVDTNALLDELG